jgi:hypothetical protein
MTPEQTALFNQLLKQAQTGMSGASPTYPGQMSVDPTQLDKSYLGYAQGIPSSLQAYQDAMTRLSSGKVDWTVPQDVYSGAQKTWQTAYQPEFQRTFNETTLPQMMESLSGTGFRSEDTAQQVRKATENFGSNLSEEEAKYIGGQETAYREALNLTLNREAQVAPQAWSSGVTALNTAGTYARTIEQEKVAGDLQRWLSGESVNGSYNPAYNSFMNVALSLLSKSPYVYSQNTETEGAGLFTSMLSSALNSGASSYGSSMGAKAAASGDDRRTPSLGQMSWEDIKALGQMNILGG